MRHAASSLDDLIRSMVEAMIEAHMVYLLVGKDFHKMVNDKVVVDGKLEPSPTQNAMAEIDVKDIRINGAAVFCNFPTGFTWCAVALAAGGTALGVGIYEATKPGASP